MRPDEFSDHDAAVRDYKASTDPHLTARLGGEIHELLALDLEEHEYAVGVAELGMEVEPPAPLSVGRWLESVADHLVVARPDYGKEA